MVNSSPLQAEYLRQKIEAVGGISELDQWGFMTVWDRIHLTLLAADPPWSIAGSDPDCMVEKRLRY